MEIVKRTVEKARVVETPTSYVIVLLDCRRVLHVALDCHRRPEWSRTKHSRKYGLSSKGKEERGRADLVGHANHRDNDTSQSVK